MQYRVQFCFLTLIPRIFYISILFVIISVFKTIICNNCCTVNWKILCKAQILFRKKWYFSQNFLPHKLRDCITTVAESNLLIIFVTNCEQKAAKTFLVLCFIHEKIHVDINFLLIRKIKRYFCIVNYNPI